MDEVGAKVAAMGPEARKSNHRDTCMREIAASALMLPGMTDLDSWRAPSFAAADHSPMYARNFDRSPGCPCVRPYSTKGE